MNISHTCTYSSSLPFSCTLSLHTHAPAGGECKDAWMKGEDSFVSLTEVDRPPRGEDLGSTETLTCNWMQLRIHCTLFPMNY